MLYSEKLKDFQSAHKYESTIVDGARYRYILCGKESGRTLVFLNGGMNTLEMWMDYVDPIGADARVLLFDYPQELATNQALVVGMHAFFAALGIEKPISATTTPWLIMSFLRWRSSRRMWRARKRYRRRQCRR